MNFEDIHMITYRCWEDCTVAGCPTHTVECQRQNSVNLLHFVDDAGNERLIPESEFKAMVEAYKAKYDI